MGAVSRLHRIRRSARSEPDSGPRVIFSGVLMASLFSDQSDPESLSSLIAVQDAIEVLVVVTAARNCTAEHAESINRQLHALRESNGQVNTMQAMWGVDIAIARATGNEVLSTVYCDVVGALQRSTLWSEAPDPRMVERKLLHETLALAVMANDVENAQLAALRHSPPSTELPDFQQDSAGQLKPNSRTTDLPSQTFGQAKPLFLAGSFRDSV